MKRAALSFLILPVLALAACGSSEAENVANSYLEAQQSGNWTEMCQNLDKASQEALQTSLKQAGGRKVKPASCAEAIEGATEQTKNAIVQGATGVKVISVEEVGDQAFISSERNGVPSKDRLQMVREGDVWKVRIAG